MLHIERAERADLLVDGLAEVLKTPLEDPLRAEVVAVPTRGVERWVTQRLSGSLGATPGRSDGVCANVDFPFPGRLVGGATAVATGVDREADPWRPEHAAWPLLEVVAAELTSDWLRPLAGHLGGGGADADPSRRARRFAAVRQLADLFDRYGVHRPAMVTAWSAGHDSDGTGQPVPSDLRWQVTLWRHLRQAIGAPSPAERLSDACEAIRSHPESLDLPGRVSLFGMTRLPASFLAVLDAIAAGRDVHLFLLHPSPDLWRRVASLLHGSKAPPRRRDDATAALPRNPLLRSWARDAREMQLVLATTPEPPVDHLRTLRRSPTTLLHHLQEAVSADALPPGEPLPGEPDRRRLLAPDDDSLRIHSCHGRARQVEVLRDAILHLLAEHPSLEPRDVIVMCPDIETFAPLITAAFGPCTPGYDEDEAAGATSPAGLRVRLADRSLRQTNPVLRVVSDLLSLVDSRLTASQVLDLADREPVRRRFLFDDDDLERIAGWVASSGIRWGADAEHRRPFRLEALEANTWRSGLRRLLLGVAMAEDGQRLVGGSLPVDDVGSGDIDLAGRFAEFFQRLTAVLQFFRGPHPILAWADAIASGTASLTAAQGSDAWQHRQLQRMLDGVVAEATLDDTVNGELLAAAEVRALFADRLRGRPTRANFRTGFLTICTLVPMRSVPHKVVCLLGLDEGSFPRRTARDGDDLLLRDPHVGDRDPRSEDRQLLLDALLSAREHLVITYTGRDERTNAARPPAVPVGELLDVVDAMAGTGELRDGRALPARERVVVEHPLQPFDTRNFALGMLAPRRRWSFDDVALAGAKALSDGPTAREDFLEVPLPAADAGIVELADLEAFLRHPVRAFLRQRLGVSLSDRDDDVDDAMPVDLDGLGQWGVGQRMLEARLSGASAEACAAAERARGLLPPGCLGEALLQRIGPVVDGIAGVAAELAPVEDEPTSIEVDVAVGGVRLVGSVPDVVGDRIRTVTYSRVGPNHRLVAWARLLAASSTSPQRPLSAVTVGKRSGGGAGVTVVTVPALADPADERRAAARRELGVLIDLYLRGMREPLPLYCDTSAAYAKLRGPSSTEKARSVWESTYDRDAEDRQREHQLVLGGTVTFDELSSAAPRDGEAGDGWAMDEASRFGRYARRLWNPLLEREVGR